ncbi:hypothetical protein PRIEUP_LOCUS36, partial [Pristimantis euphronides]
MEMTAVEIDFEVCDVENGILQFKGKFKSTESLQQYPAWEDNLETDAWKKTERCKTGMIENIFKQCLVARPDDPDGCTAVFDNPGSDRQTFALQIYSTTNFTGGLSVVFTVTYKNEKYYMCCTQDMKIYFKKGECPNRITGDRSEIIFFQKAFSEGDGCFRFQSALHEKYYLAVSNEDGKSKLILQYSDGLNEREKFDI